MILSISNGKGNVIDAFTRNFDYPLLMEDSFFFIIIVEILSSSAAFLDLIAFITGNANTYDSFYRYFSGSSKLYDDHRQCLCFV